MQKTYKRASAGARIFARWLFETCKIQQLKNDEQQ